MVNPAISDGVRLALFEATREVAEYFTLACKDLGVLSSTYVAPYDSMAGIADDIGQSVDVIVCRSGTAEYIGEGSSVPVIPIPITPLDVISALHKHKIENKKVVFFTYIHKFPDIQQTESLCNCQLLNYTFATIQDIYNGLTLAKKNGANICIGGTWTLAQSKKLGIPYLPLFPNNDSVFRSIVEAINVAKVRKKERNTAARLKVIFDSISEGIIATNEENKIIVYNPAAERIFRKPEGEVVGRHVQDVIPNTRMTHVFETGIAEKNQLQELHGDVIATNRTPITLDGSIIGVVSTFDDVTSIQQMEQIIRKHMHSKGFVAKYTFPDILTRNAKMLECKHQAALYAETSSSIIIEGESGTGKELFAQSIHQASKRNLGPFVAVNCAAIPDNLLESELFGYEGGAFTGARKEGKAGLFELAHMGTLFLDEIGEIPGPLQSRLLRVLQEREIRRVGGDKIIPVDIRIISATNKNLFEKVQAGEFRRDLFYRLNVLALHLPPLRERKEDLELLASFFLRKNDVVPTRKLLESILPLLTAYEWPGNLRELQNIIERFSLLATRGQGPRELRSIMPETDDGASSGDILHLRIDAARGLKEAVRVVETEVVRHCLEKCDFDLDVAAGRLGIGRTSVWRKSKL